MATEEWEQKMNELRDAQLATQRLIEHNERSWRERFEADRQDWSQRFEAQQVDWSRRFDTQQVDWNRRIETLIGSVQSLVSIVQGHEQRLGNTEDEIAAMRAALTSLMQTVDRFIRGQQSNGHQ
jgi:hypothetical protein